jgi:hypothetical protein
MTDTTSPNPGRAQLFELLREGATAEVPAQIRPTYLEAQVADMMISRAMASFRAPPCAMDPGLQPQPKAQGNAAVPGLSHLTTQNS